MQDRIWAQKWNVKNVSMEAGTFTPESGNEVNNGSYSARWYVTGAMAFQLWNAKDLSISLYPVFGIIYLPNQTRAGILDSYLLGSQLNNLFAIAPQVDWRVSDRFLISGNIRLNHISNGARKLPNRGLNYTTAGMGMYYSWGQNSGEALQKTEENHSGFSLSLASSLGIKAIKDKSQDQWVNMWQLAAQYRNDYRAGYILSTDYFLTWNRAEGKQPGQLNTEESPGATLGLAPGVMLHLGRLKLVGQVGAYLWSENKTSKNLYQNVGFEYHFLSHWSVIAYMRLHTFDTADCMIFGLRYSQPMHK